MGFLLRSNIFIGLCAATLAYSTFELFEVSPDLIYVLFVFGSTVATYSILRNGKLMLQRGFPKPLLITTGVSGMVALVAATQLSFTPTVLWVLLGLALLCGWYGAHWEGGFLEKISLRQAGWIKLVTIGLVWTASTAALPLLMTDEPHLFGKREWVFFAQQFFFIILLTIPFDIKDHIREQALGARSLPVIVGDDTAKKIARMLTLVFWALAGFGGMITLLTASVCSLLFLGWINQDIEQKNINQVTLLFDGLLLIEAALFIGFTYFL